MKIKDRIKEMLASPAGEGLADDVRYLTIDTAALFAWIVSLQVVAVIVALVGYQIMASGGLAAVIAQLMAATCTNAANIPCEYDLLSGGAAIAIIILTSLAITVYVAIAYVVGNMERADMAIGSEPSRAYNDEMVKLLRDIQALKVVTNLKGLADWKGLSVTTARRHCEQFEKDGYVRIHSNGKGAPVKIEAIK